MAIGDKLGEKPGKFEAGVAVDPISERASPSIPTWNQIACWLREMDGLG